jgi:hypothetical protein
MSMTTLEGRPQADFSLLMAQAAPGGEVEDFMAESLARLRTDSPVAVTSRTAKAEQRVRGRRMG